MASLLRVVILELSPGGQAAAAIVVPKVYIPIAEVFFESDLEIALIGFCCGLVFLVSLEDIRAVNGGV